jgi:PAS domain S-box-containing protein
LPAAKFEYISPSVTLVTGYAPEEYYADPALLVNLIHPDDAPLYDSFVKNPAASDDLPLTFRLIRKDRKVIWLEQKTFPVSDMAGNISAVEGILRDVTARKNLEQIVSRAEKMNLVGQMAVSVAHEIRNPLTSVRGYLQLLSMKEENTTIKDRYNLMIEELDRTNLIVSEYLLLAKEKVPNLQNCCLNNIIITLLPLMQAAAKDAKVEIKLALEDTPRLHLDENEIRQLLFNLVNNGLDAMTAGGELVIGTSHAGDKVILSVSDQGCGIPPHIRENLGTPFLTTKDTGTGLGLTVCYRIVNRHKAAMRVETGEEGTTFFVEFDVTEPAA